jgi:histone H3/H4
MENDQHLDNGIKKPSRKNTKRRRRPGTKALKEIKFYQLSERRLIPVAAFKRVVRECLQDISPEVELGIRVKAFDMVHALAEDFLTRMFKNCQNLCLHAKRKTIQVDDIHTLNRVLIVEQGGEDLNEKPINPRMSAAHRKECRAQNKERARRSRNRNKQNEKKKPVFKLAALEDLEVENEEIGEEEEGGELPVVVDDEWLLGDEM